MIAWCLALLVGIAHAGPAVALPDSTWRIVDDETPTHERHRFELLLDETRCRQVVESTVVRGADGTVALPPPGPAREREVESCLPWVDPASRRLHVSVDVRRDDVPVPMALDSERLSVALIGPDGPHKWTTGGVRVVPHGHGGVRQLFVIVVDQSASMYRTPAGGTEDDPKRIEQVVRALLTDGVQDTFFPSHEDYNGVVLLGFQRQVRGLSGEALPDVRVIRSRDAYRDEVARLLQLPPAGPTHLYDAVGRVIEELLLVNPDVRSAVELTQADPALIVVTDGFNSVSRPGRALSEQTCADNAEPLSEVLGVIDRAYSRPGRTGVRLYTVGLGESYRAGDFVPPRGRVLRVAPPDLCGRWADARIDPPAPTLGLEDRGIDAPSLHYLANAGGGRVYVGPDPAGVADLLVDSSRQLSWWFELELTLDESLARRFRHRMPLVLDVVRPKRLHLGVTLEPSPWWEGPPPRTVAGGHVRPPSVLGATAVLVVGLGATLAGFLLWVALGHAWRAARRRARRVDVGPPP